MALPGPKPAFAGGVTDIQVRGIPEEVGRDVRALGAVKGYTHADLFCALWDLRTGLLAIVDGDEPVRRERIAALLERLNLDREPAI